MANVLSRLRRDVTRATFRGLNRVVMPAVRAGLGTPLLPLSGGLVVLETTGRVSGEVRSVPLAAVRVGDDVRVSTLRGQSQWVRNLEADSSAAVWLQGRRRSATASVERGRLSVATMTLGDEVSAA